MKLEIKIFIFCMLLFNSIFLPFQIEGDLIKIICITVFATNIFVLLPLFVMDEVIKQELENREN